MLVFPILMLYPVISGWSALLCLNWNLSLSLSFVHAKNICILFNDLAAVFYFYFFLIWAHNSDTNTENTTAIQIVTNKNGNLERESKHASRKDIDTLSHLFHILKYTCFFIGHVIYTCTFSFGICEQKLINIFLIV